MALLITLCIFRLDMFFPTVKNQDGKSKSHVCLQVFWHEDGCAADEPCRAKSGPRVIFVYHFVSKFDKFDQVAGRDPEARPNSFFAYAVWFWMFLLKNAYACICWLFRAILWSCCWQKCVGLLLEVKKCVCFGSFSILYISIYTDMHIRHTHIHIYIYIYI